MPAEPPILPAANDAIRQFQVRRLVQIILLTLIAIAASTVHNLLVGNWPSVALLIALAAGLLFAYWKARRGAVELASTVMLMMLTTIITAFTWAYQGVRDPAILAYPAILVMTSMLANRRLFIAVMVVMISSIALLVLANMQGWHVSVVRPVRAGTFIDVAGILTVTGFCVWLMAGDLHQALAGLQGENERVRLSQARIEYLAKHDSLTGLPNRLLARDRFDLLQAQARRNQTLVALLYLDLDNFKAVNDSLGHVAGDSLLCEVAQRLQQSVRAGDTVCRQGGDEFLVVLGELQDGDAAAAIAIKILALMGQQLQLSGLEVATTCSVGIALSPDDGQDFDTLLKKADMAMYRAKEAGRNAFRFYDAEMNASVIEHLHLVSGMRTALARGEFTLHYQPQFDLQHQRVVGAEALIRWRHPELGLIPPARFIPVAEKSGLIIEIGAWVLDEACRQAMAWRVAGLGELTMSVNLSPVQFRRDDIERLILNVLESTGLPPACLELELTESLLIEDTQQFTSLLQRLRALGVCFSIDDFGTGYSNLGYLKRFEVERLKIDQSFVRRLTEKAHDEAIVRAIIQMSHSLQLGTVAEGVEDGATLAQLREMGCDRAQGFYWSPALPAEEFLDFVRARQT